MNIRQAPDKGTCCEPKAMKSDDADPVRRWLEVRDFYSEFAAKPGWEFLSPMIGLAEWVAHQPMASRLYPMTSHEWLTVSFSPGYDPERPFVVALSRSDARFSCELFGGVAEPLDVDTCPLEKANELFAKYIDRLELV